MTSGQCSQLTSFLCHLLLSSAFPLSCPLLMWARHCLRHRIHWKREGEAHAPLILAICHSSHRMFIKCTLPLERPLVTGQSFSAVSWAVMQVTSDQHTLNFPLAKRERCRLMASFALNDHTHRPSQLKRGRMCLSESERVREWERGRGKWPEKT